jgi:hypothetical protein
VDEENRARLARPLGDEGQGRAASLDPELPVSVGIEEEVKTARSLDHRRDVGRTGEQPNQHRIRPRRHRRFEVAEALVPARARQRPMEFFQLCDTDAEAWDQKSPCRKRGLREGPRDNRLVLASSDLDQVPNRYRRPYGEIIGHRV